MKNDNTQSNRRGSSPIFQDPEGDFYKWLNGLKSIGQRDETVSAIKVTRQIGKEKRTTTDLTDDSQWQDVGGESGEAV
jgi:hypothetical protein